MADPQAQTDPFSAFGGTPTDQGTTTANAPTTPASGNPFSEFGGTAIPSSVPAPAGPSDEEKASQTRQMLVSGLTGMPTPNMTDEDKKSFARGKAAGAISVPVVAAATVGGALAAPHVADLAGQAAEYAEYYGGQAKDALAKIAAEHPKAVIAAKAYGTWLAGHVASKLGIPMPKIVKALVDL